jgi:hypothetical protein
LLIYPLCLRYLDPFFPFLLFPIHRLFITRDTQTSPRASFSFSITSQFLLPQVHPFFSVFLPSFRKLVSRSFPFKSPTRAQQNKLSTLNQTFTRRTGRVFQAEPVLFTTDSFHIETTKNGIFALGIKQHNTPIIPCQSSFILPTLIQRNTTFVRDSFGLSFHPRTLPRSLSTTTSLPFVTPYRPTRSNPRPTADLSPVGHPELKIRDFKKIRYRLPHFWYPFPLQFLFQSPNSTSRESSLISKW